MESAANVNLPEPERYKLHRLAPVHESLVAALIAYAEVHDSLVWPPMRQINDKLELARQLYQASLPVVRGWLTQGLSYGVFDTEHTPSLSSSEPDSIPFDSPLVSVAMCGDVATPVDREAYSCLARLLPELGSFYKLLEDLDTAPISLREIQTKGDVVWCSGIYTRRDHAGRGFARVLSHWLMDTMAERGYSVIATVSNHPAVSRIWENPPARHQAKVACELDPAKYASPISLAQTVSKRIYVALSDNNVEGHDGSAEETSDPGSGTDQS